MVVRTRQVSRKVRYNGAESARREVQAVLSRYSGALKPMSGRRCRLRDQPTGTITLLFTDIEGSTYLLQLLGQDYSRVLSKCRHLLRASFNRWHGHEVDTQGMPSWWPSLARLTLSQRQ
jgi:class 3 adenylate cyclase